MRYFDNAATTLIKPPEVAEAFVQALSTFGGAGRGMHQASLAAAMTVYETREKLARFYGAASPHQVAFSLNATEALNVAIESLVRPGDHVLTTAASHNSVLRPLYRKEKKGVKLSILPLSKQGSMNYDQLDVMLSQNVSLMVLTHASNLTGEIYDLQRVAASCKKANVVLVLDAAQTGGHLSFDMQKTGVDVVVFTGHKGFFGPQGTGGLCVADHIDLAPYKVGGSGTHSYDKHHPTHMPEKLEAGTLNSHGIAGLSAGIDYIEGYGVQGIAQKITRLTTRFRQGALTIKGIKIYGNPIKENCGIVALNIAGIDAAECASYLDYKHGICVRAGAHCAPLMHEALGTAQCGALRFSFSSFNTEVEIDSTLEVLDAIAHENF